MGGGCFDLSGVIVRLISRGEGGGKWEWNGDMRSMSEMEKKSRTEQ